MPREMQVKGGKILLWRIGNLEYGKQARWAHNAPVGETRGMWAFPWPYFDIFFASHKYEDVSPKRYRTMANGAYPASLEWYRRIGENGEELPLLPGDLEKLKEWQNSPLIEGEFGKRMQPIPDEFTYAYNFWENSEKWMNTTGKRLLPIKKFWYEGELYSHLEPRRNNNSPIDSGSGISEWHRMGTQDFANAVKRVRGIAMAAHSASYPTGEFKFTKYNRAFSCDHLEVFLPQGAGRISGNLRSN